MHTRRRTTQRDVDRAVAIVLATKALVDRSTASLDLLLARARAEPNDFRELTGNVLENAPKWAETLVGILAQRQESSSYLVIEDD